MDTLDNNLFESTSLSEDAKAYLKETAKWSRFLSILGFVMIGFIVIAAFAAGTIFTKLGTMATNPAMTAMGGMGAMFTVVYLLMAALYFFPTLYLYKFSVKMLGALKGNIVSSMTEAFKNLKSVFKFWGIFSIVILSFYGIILLFALLALAVK
ncbi:MAG TPA: hypothetical protein VL947_09720 [Cytophagales bacterium]|nr:hypothetical protein [Cytophagales bacterium]